MLRPTMQGRCLREVQVGGFRVMEALYEPSTRLASHAHAEATICFVIEGSFSESSGTSPHDCGPSSLVVKPAGVVHANQYGEKGARCLIVEIETDRLDLLRKATPLQVGCVYRDAGATAWLAMRLYWELGQGDPASRLAIEGLTLTLLAESWCRPQPSPIDSTACIADAERFLREHFHERLGIGDVARAVGVHPTHLARSFQEHHKCSLGAYLRLIRLNWAARKLVECELSLAEIAIAAGFYDQAHFSNLFKQHTGMTPAVFRFEASHVRPEA